MSVEELQMLVKRGEGLRTEFKHKAADPQKIMREVVAFSNCVGGRLIIGVDDDGTIRGLKDVEEEEFALLDAIERFCKPLPNFKLQRIPLNRKRSVLVLDIKEGETKPMFVIYNVKRKTGRAYFRVADKSVQVSRELRHILKKQHLEQQPFAYGATEQELMAYLRDNPTITLPDFMALSNISEEDASDILVQLTIARVLQIHPSDKLDQYALANL